MAKKYYAIRYKNGRHIVVKSLSKYKQLIKQKKFKAAKGFDSLADAEAWCKEPAYFPSQKCVYAVKVGKTPGIYYSEEEFMDNIIGVPKSRGKMFYTEEGAREWLGLKRFSINSILQVDKIIHEKFYEKWWSNLQPKLSQIRVIRKLQQFFQRFAIPSRPWIFCNIKAQNPLIIYTDASYKATGTGYAAIIIDSVTGTEICVGGKSSAIMNSSNAELHAIVSALRAIDSSKKADIEIRTDCLSIIEAAYSFKFHNQQEKYKTGIWKDFYDLFIKHNIKMTWVKGHNGEAYNTQCDKIARRCSG